MAVQAYILDRAWHEPGLTEKLLDFAVERACLPVSWMTDQEPDPRLVATPIRHLA